MEVVSASVTTKEREIEEIADLLSKEFRRREEAERRAVAKLKGLYDILSNYDPRNSDFSYLVRAVQETQEIQDQRIAELLATIEELGGELPEWAQDDDADWLSQGE